MDELGAALADAGGMAAPSEHLARLRALLGAELARGAGELALPRSGYEQAVTVAFADASGATRAVLPVTAGVRADADAVPERSWLLVAAVVGALAQSEAAVAGVLAGSWRDDRLVLQAAGGDAELASLAFADEVARVDRLRADALAVPAGVLADVQDLREPIGAAHPLHVAARIAVLGGRPADPASVAEHEDAALAALETEGSPAARPHADPDPSRRIARRILQRLDGMGKWGGYHTEFVHLSRGFRGNDRAVAESVGEALLDSGLLAEKPSVGQRHVFLDPSRAADIRALVDDGVVPPGLVLPGSDQRSRAR